MTRDLDAGRLEALLESARLLHQSLDLEDLLKHLLRSVMGRLVVGKGFLALAADGAMTVRIARGLKSLPAGTPIDEQTARDAGIALVLPIGEPARPMGLLGVSRPLAGEARLEDREFLEALLGIAASAIANARAHAEAQWLNRELDRQVHQLQTLLDLVRGLTTAVDPGEVAGMLGRTLAGQWLVRKYAVAAWKEGHPPVLVERGMGFDSDAALAAGATELTRVSRVQDLPPGPLRSILEDQDARLVAPLVSGESGLGFAALGAPATGREYSPADLEFCSGLASQAVVALENAWHFAETLEKKKLEEELALAASIQERLFPATLPELAGFAIAARNRPARQVGGDYYDVIPVAGAGPDQPYLLCVADVSGKGIAASLLMSNVQATFRALLAPERPIAELVARTNDLIHATTPGNKFVTAILIVVDPTTGHCRYVNAGHNSGILLRAAGDVEYLDPGGVPIGLLPDRAYKEASFAMAPGDLLAIFSDGVTEANDVDGNELGDDRLLAYLRELADRPADELVDTVFDAVDRFAGSAPQYDDITLMVAKRTKG